MSDANKILSLLKQRGSQGLHSFDIIKLCATTRGAARILDLKHRGYKITSKPEKMGNAVGCRYFLNLPPQPQGYWKFEGSKATWITPEDEKPKQLGLI